MDEGLTRRRLLQVGLLGGAVLGLSSLGLALRATVERIPKRPLQALDSKSYSILAAIADRISPAGDGFPPAATLEVAENIDSVMAKLHPADVVDFQRALLFVENAMLGFVFDGRTQSFTASSPQEQDAILEAFRSSSLTVRRSIFKAVYGLCAGAYWNHASHGPRVGYPGQPDYGNGKGTEPSRAPIDRRSLEPRGPLEPDEEAAGEAEADLGKEPEAPMADSEPGKGPLPTAVGAQP